MGTPGFRDALFLVSKGVPYEIALRMKPARRMAHVITLTELEGGRRYDWNRGRWEESR